MVMMLGRQVSLGERIGKIIEGISCIKGWDRRACMVEGLVFDILVNEILVLYILVIAV